MEGYRSQFEKMVGGDGSSAELPEDDEAELRDRAAAATACSCGHFWNCWLPFR
jgi:hypothetical protein